MPESITEIVNKAKNGDAAAFTSLVTRFQDMAMGLAYGSTLGMRNWHGMPLRKRF